MTNFDRVFIRLFISLYLFFLVIKITTNEVKCESRVYFLYFFVIILYIRGS